ncbi:hypothetical protein Tel_17045 (plasmid) [Candidatus Tenderia electrophaga]|uniref:TraG P-loop domain-containing protein n=1 Tax=Candidatus Tenderia electrophaga TaxID=1748243 RepID=A0A0S2TIH8_9GAMM|nr:hypothetical protein Tel_17045 [Candidatus Tenderia electrophaga]
MSYHRHYTWSHPLTASVIAHSDGAVSVMVVWDGLDSELLTDTQRQQQFFNLYQLLNRFERGYVAEFHLWREYDASLAREYIERGGAMERGQAFAAPLRQDMAEHLANMAMANRVALVVTKRPAHRPLFARKALVRQSRDALALEAYVQGLLRFLPAGRLATLEEYAARVQQSLYRPAYITDRRPRVDQRYSLREQWVREKPAIEGAMLQCQDQHTKVLFLYMYPDAAPAWFAGMAALPCPLHVSHIVEAVDTKAAMRKSEGESDLAEGLMSRRGRDYSAKGLSDLSAFRQFVADNNLGIYKNAYIIHLHGTEMQVSSAANSIADWVETHGGQVRSADYIQLPYFRVGQPGQGYRSPMLRPDDQMQVADMLPVQVYNSGERHPESLRIGAAGQLVGFNYTSLKLSHGVTSAKTGMGKGVDKVATILETYPFGVDWYIAEIGESYRWVVEGFGGSYSKVDPNETVINPLPPYTMATTDAGSLPLDAIVAGGTVQALAFILADGKTSLDVHQEAAAQTALQLLYAVPAKQAAPTLDKLLLELQDTGNFGSEPQLKAAQVMASNLESFLHTTEGRLFTRQDNLSLSEGITGVDLKDVDKASPKLLQFYLVFLSLRYSHLAFARRRPARVLLDEMHKFVRVAPEVVGRLISELARMGRKDAGAIDLVTQGIHEIDTIESEVLNSMSLYSLLYREDEHDEIAQRLNMPAGALETWRAYPFPMEFDWRPALRAVGDRYFNLHLSFPARVLALANTDPAILDLKTAIGAHTEDPLMRLQLLGEEIQTLKQIKERRDAA